MPRKIVDAGCGDNILIKRLWGMYNWLGIGVDLYNTNADIVKDILHMPDLLNKPDLLFTVCRPSHGIWVEQLAERVVGELLYIGLEKNLTLDFSENVKLEPVNFRGSSPDGEKVWRVVRDVV